jgi:copper homeostasis protein
MLEVIATSVADALAAEAGGADRVELISALERDGLTPPVALVEAVRAAVRIPVRVMLRDRDGFSIDSAGVAALCDVAERLQALDVDGLVLGFTHRGVLNTAAIRAICAAAPALRVTFHRAIEHVRNLSASLDMLEHFPQIDTLLHSGGPGDVATRVAALSRLHSASAGRFTILAGGGMSLEMITALLRDTTIRAFHTGRAARVPQTVVGAVDTGRVRALKTLIG